MATQVEEGAMATLLTLLSAMARFAVPIIRLQLVGAVVRLAFILNGSGVAA